MIARNYRRFPEALALQLTLDLVCVVVRKVRERHNAARQIPRCAVASHDIDAEDIPVGSIVRTPTGKEAKVLGYRGKRRDHIIRLWCQYLQPDNRRFDKVLLAPKLVTILQAP